VHLVHVTGMVTGLDARLTSAPGLAVAGLDSPGRALAAAGPRTLRDIPNEVASSPAITPCPGWLQRWIYQVPEPVPALSPATKTRVMLESLGPTYVKLGQIVSSQASTLPDDWRIQLDRLQNEVPPVPYQAARQVITGELGAPPEEFSSTLLEELDYYGEAHNMVTLAKNMEPVTGVHIPTLYQSLSGRRVPTQEFVAGVKISEVDAMRRAGLDVAQVGEAALRAAIKMLLIDGFFHADPHPGNLFVSLDTGVVTFLDCGMVGELTVTQPAHLVMLLWTFVHGSLPAMADQLRALSVPFRGAVDDRAFSRAFEHQMSRYDRGAGSDVKLVLSSAMGVLRDHGLRLDPQLTLALKAMAQSSAFFTQLAPPDRPFTEAALDAVSDLAEQTFTEEYLTGIAKTQGIRLASRAAQEAPDYLKGLLSWRDQLKKGRLTIYLDTSAVDRQVDQLRGITASVVIGVLVGATMIASAVAAQVFRQYGPHYLARAAELAFAVSLGLAAILVIGYVGRMFPRRRDRQK
jgi:predicted unusual protein kinase regulating ubiquinone biosynthesis (AarF/ABC1/UbiB family)